MKDVRTIAYWPAKDKESVHPPKVQENKSLEQETKSRRSARRKGWGLDGASFEVEMV